ncbi:hypothetical protein ACIQXI_20900 [Lysinibacillus sp. NPDC097195]|uniref:hypothetical protein n=1 Tax=Lysinibacillus sp. NPDC097195 TaxID=3364141 RepID=UPI003818D505
MKKWLLSLTIAGSCFFATDALAKEAVVWDGAEVDYGQVGKMTFSKDVKVYKQNTDETFTSLVVKKGNFFRVYGVEQTSIGKVYTMSGGYRVQATDLVIYREVPLSIQQQLGTSFTKGSNIFVSSKGGVAIKPEPRIDVDSIGHTKHGAILQVIGTEGDYVKVMYDPGQGSDYVVEGYVPKNFVSAIPTATTQYLTEEVRFGKQIEATSHMGNYPRGQKVSTYFTTVSGYTYISIGNVFGFVKTTSLSNDKVIDKPLQKIDVSANIAFDTTKEINYGTSDSPATSGVTTSGLYKPVSPNSLEGTIYSTDGDVEFFKKSMFQANVTDKEIVYKIDDMTIKLAFPVKVGDAIEVNGKKYKIEKILETYTPHYSTSTVENAIFAGDFVIGKEYIYQGTQFYWHAWYHYVEL